MVRGMVCFKREGSIIMQTLGHQSYCLHYDNFANNPVLNEMTDIPKYSRICSLAFEPITRIKHQDNCDCAHLLCDNENVCSWWYGGGGQKHNMFVPLFLLKNVLTL